MGGSARQRHPRFKSESVCSVRALGQRKLRSAFQRVLGSRIQGSEWEWLMLLSVVLNHDVCLLLSDVTQPDIMELGDVGP